MSTRRLAAVLSADIVGFSGLMERDEEGTLTKVKRLQREVLDPILRSRGGRLVKTLGDGYLVEFSSPSEAVRSCPGSANRCGGLPGRLAPADRYQPRGDYCR